MTKDHDTLRVSVYNFFHAGGIGRYTADLLPELAKAPDLAIELMCTPQFKWQNLPGVSVWPGLTRITHPLPPLRRARFLYANWTSPQRGLARARKVGADIIHFSEFNALTFPFWKDRLVRSGARMVVSVHDVRRRKALFHRGWEDRNLVEVYRRADALLVHSRFQARELREFSGVGEEKIQVVPHGPYDYGRVEEIPAALRRRLGLPEEATIGLLFGQIRDDKNLDGLLEGLARTDRPVHLLVAGTAGGRHRPLQSYRDRAGALGLADRVHFREGFVPDTEVAGLFTAADWVALPYRSSFTSQSGVLNVAAQYERPVLVAGAPVLAESVRDHDIGVAAGGDDPADLAEGLDRLLDRLEGGQPFAFSAYREKNSWAENARLTREVYRRLREGEMPQARRQERTEVGS